MAQTIPADVSSVRRGMLPKDVIEKLKQIEKLSKRLRTELNPQSGLGRKKEVAILTEDGHIQD